MLRTRIYVGRPSHQHGGPRLPQPDTGGRTTESKFHLWLGNKRPWLEGAEAERASGETWGLCPGFAANLILSAVASETQLTYNIKHKKHSSASYTTGLQCTVRSTQVRSLCLCSVMLYSGTAIRNGDCELW
jgi:hypothetical protein